MALIDPIETAGPAFTRARALLNASAERIVAEGRHARAGIDRLSQSVLEIPGEDPALGIGEGIAGVIGTDIYL